MKSVNERRGLLTQGPWGHMSQLGSFKYGFVTLYFVGVAIVQSV
jgi:hypothetical protein